MSLVEGVPVPGLVVFQAAIGSPEMVRQGGASVWFESRAVVRGVTAAEVVRLGRTEHLRLGYQVRAGRSGDPVLHAGRATVEAGGEGGLLCRWMLPVSVFGTRTARLLHFGFLYEGLGRFEEWGYPGTWAVASIGRREPFAAYFSTFNADRA